MQGEVVIQVKVSRKDVYDAVRVVAGMFAQQQGK